ncbi:hypothetical protein HYQ46_003982 [Verticillium longisporum]|nr:hypothetical protein HYQ44_018031 [Verticillium longisporum]KAG7152888.1 hypothetical protein HYQ46_003982 [Verticillium longisporum]
MSTPELDEGFRSSHRTALARGWGPWGPLPKGTQKSFSTNAMRIRLIVDHGRARHGPCTCLFGHSASPLAPEADGGRSAIPSMSNP